MTKKKIIALGLAGILFVGCCVQGVRKDILKSESTGNMSHEDLSDLVLENINVQDIDTVNLADCSLKKETAVIAQLVREDELSDEEIRKCGQAVVYVESRYLGIKEPPVLIINEDETSYYKSEDNTIYLSKKDIEKWTDYVEEIVHVNYHAYEREQIAMYHSLDEEYKGLKVFWDAQSWSKEQEKYSRCGKTSENLWIEKDAIQYSKSGKSDYIRAVCEYWHYSEEYLNIELEQKVEDDNSQL